MRSEYVFFAVFGLVAIGFLYQVIRNRGFRGAIFGAPIGRTIGEVDLGRRGMVWTKLKVHRLESRDANSPEVGIEVASKAIGAFSWTGHSLSRDQAMALSGLLSQAANEGVRQT